MDETLVSADTDDIPRPYWIPAGLKFDELSHELQVAVVGVINPAYRELVLQAAPGLEQSTGLTIVHLLWLEILEQIALARGLPRDTNLESRRARQAQIDRYLRLVGAKGKASHLLLRIREVAEKQARLFDPAKVPQLEQIRAVVRTSWREHQRAGAHDLKSQGMPQGSIV